MSNAETIPVIVGCGEILDRPASVADAKEPLTLMAEAVRLAEADAGAVLRKHLDSIDIVNLVSWRYSDIGALLSDALGVSPKRVFYGEIGGESPVRLLHDAALRIQSGASQAALVCGAEAQHSAAKARREAHMPPWTPFAKDGPKPPSWRELVHPLAADIGLSPAVAIYPLYDMASAAAWGQTPAEALAESGAVWARYSEAATHNPYAWLKRPMLSDEITTPTLENRLIAWPYTKLMVANPLVNQGAAVLVTSLALARKLGVSDDKLVFFHGGAAANEPRDFLARDQYTRSHAQDAVLESCMRIASNGFDAYELYSCFPCVPKMARRTLGLGFDFEPSVTGGLTFFGAPINNYMLHAACAMTRRVRERGGRGLLYGQGEFVTKHHALVFADAPRGAEIEQSYSVQAPADARRGAVPDLVAPVPSEATIETGTVLYQRDGSVESGAVLLRLDDGRRTLAAVSTEDAATLSALTNASETPVGRRGRIVVGENGRKEFQIA